VQGPLVSLSIGTLPSLSRIFHPPTMLPQFKFFDEPCEKEDLRNLPDGMRYENALITPAEEYALVARLRELPFKEFEFHGHKGKRRVVSFGWKYEFSGRGSLRKADDIPEFLLPLREAAASFARLEPEALQHVLVIEYGPGAGIGWHRDKPVFGQVVGVSMLAPCVLRFRRKVSDGNVGDRVDPAKKKSSKNTWERINLLAEPRSAYHLSGPARLEWEHSILRVEALRYSVTFRTMREE
jgi:alkylated DNA repair dioxygenase AlkB